MTSLFLLFIVSVQLLGAYGGEFCACCNDGVAACGCAATEQGRPAQCESGTSTLPIFGQNCTCYCGYTGTVYGTPAQVCAKYKATKVPTKAPTKNATKSIPADSNPGDPAETEKITIIIFGTFGALFLLAAVTGVVLLCKRRNDKDGGNPLAQPLIPWSSTELTSLAKDYPAPHPGENRPSVMSSYSPSLQTDHLNQTGSGYASESTLLTSPQQQSAVATDAFPVSYAKQAKPTAMATDAFPVSYAKQAKPTAVATSSFPMSYAKQAAPTAVATGSFPAYHCAPLLPATVDLTEASFDPESGFPINAAAEHKVAQIWQGLNTDASDNDRTFRLPYAVVRRCTNNFDKTRFIGGGGSCEVFEATIYKVRVAVKALKAMGGESEKKKKLEEQQFLAEKSLLLKVRHPNICRLLAVSSDGPQRCLVLELCPGGSLFDALKKDRSMLEAGAAPILSWRQRLSAALAVMRALVHLHMMSPPMIHRDVKSQNILLTKPDAGDEDMLAITKVSDFGTVRQDVRRKLSSSMPTGTGNQKSHASTQNVIGTKPYMPVEYMMRGHVSEKTDAFSFGILFIELITNETPEGARWVLEDSADVCSAVSSHIGTSNLEWPSKVIDIVVTLVDRCTQGKHKIRSTLAMELHGLERVLRGVY